MFVCGPSVTLLKKLGKGEVSWKTKNLASPADFFLDTLSVS